MTRLPASLERACLLMAVPLLGMLTSPAWAQSASFFDDFNSLDSSRWYVSDGYSNGAFQNCDWSAKEVTVSGGILSAGFAKGQGKDRNYLCSEMQSRTAFSYGTYEARIKMPKGSGLDAAFFTYIGPTQHAQHDETDFEVLTKDTTKVHTTTFVNNISGDGKTGNGEYNPLPYPADQDYIDYALVWQPDKMEFYANKQLIRTITDKTQIPVTPQRIFFNLWGSDTLTSFVGPFSDPGQPIAMQVDWVGYTAPGDRCKFPQSITCSQ